MTKSRKFLVLALLVILSTGFEAYAQSKRADKSFFFRPRIGLSTYGGDRDNNETEDFISLAYGDKFSAASYALGLEGGYAFTPALALVGGYNLGNYSEILDNHPVGLNVLNEDGSSTKRHTLFGVLRWMVLPSKRLSPYLQGGLNLSFGKIEELAGDSGYRSAFGPVVGLGFDYVITPKASIFLETTGFYGFPDDALDAQDPEVEDDETDFDLLGFYGAGVRFSLNPACEPARIISIDGPTNVVAGETATYTAVVNDDACQPVSYLWDFGDGTTAEGLTVTHTFDKAGNYPVSFTAGNRAGDDSQSMNTLVEEPCEEVQVVSISADPSDMIIGEAVKFSANVSGSAPMTYNWSFGDGSTSTAASPTHTFSDQGDYSVSLEVSNCGGAVSKDYPVRVETFRCSDITELNSVFFDRNSAELDAEARALLDENIAMMKECPMLVRIDGYADRRERRTQRLSEDRAKSVEQYYIENGISPNRLMPVGNGVDPLSAKGVDGRINRRADSIIVESF